MKHRKALILILVATVCLAVATLAGCGCKGCGKNKNHEHDFGELVVGIAKTCETDGTLSYYECKTCKEKYDETKTIRLTDITVKKGHEIASVKEYVVPTCKTEGNYAYSYCSACNKYLGSDGKELTLLIIPKTDHDFDGRHYERKEPTCTENGNIEYYKCGLCNGYYTKDGIGFNETTKENVILEKTNHSERTYIKEVPSSCTGDGNEGVKGHFHCGACNKDFDLKGNVVTPESLVIPATHTMVYHAKIECGCETDGVKEYSHCTVCDRNYADAAGTTLLTDLTIPKKGHSFYTNGALDESKFMLGKPATETEKGWVAHYHCDDCDLNFDADGNKLNDVYLIFGHTLKWVEERPMNCSGSIEGRKGHYECTDDGCYKLFDINGNETDLNELTIPVTHVFGDLIAAHDGDCQNKAALQDYYVCKVCNLFYDENGNRIAGIDLFGGLGDHVCEYVYENESYHKKICTVCGNEQGLFGHSGTAIYYVNANGEKVKKIECEHCGYVTPESTYFSPTDAAVQPVIVGLNDNNNVIVELAGKKESRRVELADVIDENTKRELNAFISAFIADKTKKTTEKEITVVYEDFTKTLEIGFIKVDYEFDKPYAIDSRYDVNAIDSLNDIGYVTYRATGALHYYGIVVISDEDAQRFATVKAELAKTGGEREFTYTFSYTGAESDPTYSVTITLYADMPAYVVGFRVENEVMRGNRPRIATFTYSDYTTKNVLADNLYPDEDYFFDANKSGIQSGAFVYRGLIASSVVVVHDGNEIENIVLPNNNIQLGEELYLIAKYYDGHKEIVVVTEDMVKSGNLDMKKAGTYNDVIIVYGGKECYAWRINVKDYDDDVPSSIYAEESKVLWKTDKDGNIIQNLSGIEIRVYRKNGESYFVDVTSGMISYDKNLAKEAFENGESFSVTVNYLGLTCEFEVSALTDETEIMYAGASLYFENKIFGEKYLAVGTTDYKKYYVKITADMIYNAKKTGEGTGEYVKTTPFDLASAERGIYNVIIVYGGREFAETAYVYSSSDVKSVFSVGADDYYVAGSKESVIKTIKQSLTPFYATYIDFGTEQDGIEEEDVKGTSLNVMAPDDVDFSKPGKIKLVVTYKNVATAIETELIASPSGGKVYYLVEGDDVTKITVFNEGYVFAYGEYGKFFKDDVNGVFGIKRNYDLFYQVAFYKTTGTENILEPFKASDRKATLVKTLNYFDGSDNYEYGFYNLNGKIYADTFSIRNGVKSYRETCYAEFSSDGKTVVLNGEEKYTVDGDDMRFVMEGKTVYKFVYEEDEGVYNEFYFNDDGNVYSVVVEENEDGTVTETVLGGIAKWTKQDNEVKLMLGDVELIRFEVVTVDGEETLAIIFNLID